MIHSISIRKGIDRNSVSFGAWSGLVELRGVALRSEALAVLFESLGMDLPVTVETGFIGLLRLVVPWKTIGSTPVKIELEGVNIIARPVRDDGSDDSEIKVRERRIKRAKLNTDDAVREASWNMGNEENSRRASTWSWFVSDDLLAKIIANLQIELRDLVLRFEDPLSNVAKPYAVAIHCKTLKAVSANEKWEQVFIDDIKSPRTRKLVIVDGFRVDWSPLKTSGLGRNSTSGTVSESIGDTKYTTPEQLQDYLKAEGSNSASTKSVESTANGPTNIISPISGSLRLDLLQGEMCLTDNHGSDELPSAQATVDIRFPDISMKLDDVQYSSLIQTSLYFSKLSIRGYSPKTPKERWIWAVEQLLPGFRDRRAREEAITEEGIARKREERILYIKKRLALLKARRTSPDELGNAAEELDRLEDVLTFNQIIRFRDMVDDQCVELSKIWKPVSQTPTNQKGTTMSYLWSRLGYSMENTDSPTIQLGLSPDVEASKSESIETASSNNTSDEGRFTEDARPDISSDELKEKWKRVPNVQISFHLRRGSIRLIQGGYPASRTARVDLILRDLIVGGKRFQSGGFLMEALLGTIEAWDLENNVRMVYSRVPRSATKAEADMQSVNYGNQTKTSYPTGVANALRVIRSGFETTNLPATETEESEDESFVAGVVSSGRQRISMGVEIDGIYIPSNAGIQSKQSLVAWANSAADFATHSTHRVTEPEFFGNGRDEQIASLPYISAVQIYRSIGETAQSSNRKQTHVVAAVGQLEAVVDGPKGSFLWALRFWKPKGLRKDPIIAFLGAAAGARIAELRMELKEAVLQDRLPLQIDALIRAPRFIIPGKTANDQAIVVNMGTLGIQTSENEEQIQSVGNLTDDVSLGNYSNYALSLDDLGVYIAPNESTATSSTRRLPTDVGEANTVGADFSVNKNIDVRSIERLIRPLSMRFFVQVLRDASSVQVANRANRSDNAARISRLRLRGQMPGLWFILSQKACRHLLSSVKRWSRDLLPGKAAVETAILPNSEVQPLGALDNKEHDNISVIAKLSSYDCRIAIDHVSLELRDKNDVRLVTTVASGMCASVVKTKHLCLDTEFTLKSWTITDGSRGSTAPFRRLVYAGTGANVRGVSPPRSTSRSRSQSLSESSAEDTNFVNIRHKLHFSSMEQTVDIHFLSLNLIFVRETVLKITAFFEGMRTTNGNDVTSVKRSGDTILFLPHVSSLENKKKLYMEESAFPIKHDKVSLRADFDGFKIQFVSSEGAICSIETRDFSVRLNRNASGDVKATGNVRLFAVDDLTASLREHQSLISYERSDATKTRNPIASSSAERFESRENQDRNDIEDGWELNIPSSSENDVLFRTCLKGLNIRYLARFTSVMNNYFSALKEELKKSALAQNLEASAIIEQGQKQTSALMGKQNRRFTFEASLSDVSLKLPRHSSNSDEALLFCMPTVRIHNAHVPAPGFKSRVRVALPNLQASVQYRVQEKDDDTFLYVSKFLSETAAELELDLGDMTEYRKTERHTHSGFQAMNPLVQARFSILECVSLQLCEAQYSVLYFVLTENLVESVESGAMSLERDEWCEFPEAPGPEKHPMRGDSVSGYENLEQNIDPSVLSDENNSHRKSPVASLVFQIPVATVTLSRGWNVLDKDCRVVGMTNRDVTGNIVYGQSELVVELYSSIQTMADLRTEHTIGSRSFAFPLESDESENEAAGIEKSTRNFSLAYSKAYGQRASIEIALMNIQIKVIPELLRDMSFFVVPSWPFLSTSDFAPPCAYLGRTMTVCVSDSQVLLCADEFENDSRGLVLSGRFLARLEWMPVTGAKIVSVQSTGLQVGLEYRLEQLETQDEVRICAKRYADKDSLILYPSDSHVEYFGPGVDDKGTRAHLEADSILCRINVADAPSIFAVLRRLGRLEKSHLSFRQWKHPTIEDQDVSKKKNTVMDSKTQAREKVSRTMSLSYSTPAARMLFTDESDGRFVPILELNLESVQAEGTLPDLAKVAMQISINLFSRKKGWWEPGLEPWHVEASLSQGSSGSKAFVIKSEDTLNLNLTPDTVQGAKEVSSSLRSIKDKANSFLATMKNAPVEDRNLSLNDRNGTKKDMSGPSVAAFHVRNELGLPVEIFVPISTQRSTLLHDHEFEVHMPVERLLPSYRTASQRNENFSRHDTLKCQLSIPGYSSLELSAAEVGNHSVTFLPVEQNRNSVAGDNQTINKPKNPVFAVWEIEMHQGVPICSIRSAMQAINRTNTALAICLRPSPLMESKSGFFDSSVSALSLGSEDSILVLSPGQHYSIPLVALERLIHVRPAHGSSISDRLIGDDSSDDAEVEEGDADFDWSDPINSWEWLKMANYPWHNQEKNITATTSVKSSCDSNSQTLDHEVVRCRSLKSVGPDFFIAAVPECFSQGILSRGCRLDITLQAPLTFTNKLPGRISYRISEAQSIDRGWSADNSSCAILGAGIVSPLESASIHCTDDTQNLSGISIAYENRPIESPGQSLPLVSEDDHGVPTKFGAFVSISSILNGQATIVPAFEPSENRSKFEMGTTIHVVAPNSRVPCFDLYSPFWLRNRSDIDLDVSSRSSFYAKGCNPIRSIGHPKGQQAGRFLCFNGPYLALRNCSNVGSSKSPHQWWVSSDLCDVSAPISVSLSSISLLLEVRQARGYGNLSYAVTIRNAAFVINNSDRYIQWCQASDLDEHGNCPFRHVHLLRPYEEATIHWSGNKSQQSINIRLSESDSSSDWIWSPSLPLLLGNAGEVSAKMYRPKTQEQYIARVQSSKLEGGARALMILSEDRQNPPYRILNHCKTRSIAFHQVGRQERPWLVRPGKSTRYSWDDPLAPAHKRKLQIDVIEDNYASTSAYGYGEHSRARPSTSRRSTMGQSFGVRGNSSKSAPQNLEVNIDIVNRVVSELGNPDLGISYSVRMEAATKIVSFQDTGDKTVGNVSAEISKSTAAVEEKDEGMVPVVLWDEFKSASLPTSPVQYEAGAPEALPSTNVASSKMSTRTPSLSDYPRRSKTSLISGVHGTRSMDIDAAFYLSCAGVSVVTSDPVELLYVHANNLHLTFEAYDSLQCFAFYLGDLQIDNQLENPPFPVTLWAGPQVVNYETGHGVESSQARTVAIELKRVVTDSGILMLKSFRAAVARPLNLRIDEDLVSRVIAFVNEISSASKLRRTEVLQGDDGEHLNILTRLESKDSVHRLSAFKKIKSSFKSVQRIYVEDFKLYDAQIVLSSSIARGSSSRNLSYSQALRPVVTFLMNVENCEFNFSALELRHLFSSRSHFVSLIRQFYESQLASQKMKLLTSNSLVGNPSALFDSVAIGARDLFSEPGRAKGSGEFLFGVGRGSKSLITHTVGGIVGSISGIPKAVTSGLESAVGDETYLAERERIRGSQLSGGRRMAPSNPAQGVVTGVFSFAHGISSGVTGLFKDPVQGAMQGGASGFLKGVRKGLVGGVVKPVTGVIDLIAEPAAGISKQINESDSQRRQRQVAPKRPPRTFWGYSKRLVAFDVKSATGDSLYKGVQLNCGVTYSVPLFDWVELSDRNERMDPDAAEWIWKVVRERTRAMARPRRGMKSDRANSTLNTHNDLVSQIRPEKTRVALLTIDNILVVTLDCKLVLTVPLWQEASFSLEASGKDLILVTEMDKEASPSSGSSILAETQSLFTAPWDAASTTRRRKPNPGEFVRDRVSCGSIGARENLCDGILRLLEYKQRMNQRSYVWAPALRRAPSAIELPDLSSAPHDDQSLELPSTKRSAASDGSADVFVLPVRSPGRRLEDEPIRNNVDTTDSREPLEMKSKSQLDSTIRRLSMSGTNRALEARRSIRIIVTNEVTSGTPLLLVRSALERGYWRVAVPQRIETYEAAMFEVDSGSIEEMKLLRQKGGKDVLGSVLFRLSKQSNLPASACPQALLDFSNISSGGAKYATKTTGGLVASYERGNGIHATVVFRVTQGQHISQTPSIPQWSNQSRGGLMKRATGKLFGIGSSSKGHSSSHSSTNKQQKDVPEATLSYVINDEKVSQLLDLGFSFEDAVSALEKSKGDVVKAIDFLT